MYYVGNKVEYEFFFTLKKTVFFCLGNIGIRGRQMINAFRYRNGFRLWLIEGCGEEHYSNVQIRIYVIIYILNILSS